MNVHGKKTRLSRASQVSEKLTVWKGRTGRPLRRDSKWELLIADHGVGLRVKAMMMMMLKKGRVWGGSKNRFKL